jgi:hypothetical protein
MIDHTSGAISNNAIPTDTPTRGMSVRRTRTTAEKSAPATRSGTSYARTEDAVDTIVTSNHPQTSAGQ